MWLLCGWVCCHGSCRSCLPPLPTLRAMRLSVQVCAVLCYAQQNNVEPFLEPVLQLAHAMMLHDTPAAAAGGGTPSSSGQILEVFLTQLLTFADLCSHSDPAAALAAAQCVAQLVGLCCHMVDQSASCTAHKASIQVSSFPATCYAHTRRGGRCVAWTGTHDTLDTHAFSRVCACMCALTAVLLAGHAAAACCRWLHALQTQPKACC